MAPEDSFQHHISGTAADFLCMAVKSTIEPDWQYEVSIYPAFSLFMQMEYRNKLL
ncbi:hypothetical protein [Agathobacter sp.]|jgi:hypothetical protein|uniref:hypothetical protein n=1 Tax=Agathobacter sp. TaxID=2021311 RepID=UPI002ED193D0